MKYIKGASLDQLATIIGKDKAQKVFDALNQQDAANQQNA